MKVLYLAKHDSGGNDDEGAIKYALEKLGHEVLPIHERHAYKAHKYRADLLLCHHLHELDGLRRATIPKVCWCFDLIDWSEPRQRHDHRRAWAVQMEDVVDLMFCTDGGWVEKRGGKLRWLTQGADERPCDGTFLVSSEYTAQGGESFTHERGCAFPAGSLRHEGTSVVRPTDVLFVGGLGYGRDAFVRDMRARYGDRFKHVAKGCYGAALASEVNRAKVVVAPPTPVSDRYWSNRIYNMLRLGAFLLHPRCAEMLHPERGQFYMLSNDGNELAPELMTYGSMEELVEYTDWYIPRQDARDMLSRIGRRVVMERHTYRHRVEELLRQARSIL